MAVKSLPVTVGSSSASLTAAIPGHNGGDILVSRTIAIQNNGTGTVYVGGPDVSTTNGYAIVAGSERSFDLTQRDDLWAVSTANQACRVLHLGV